MNNPFPTYDNIKEGNLCWHYLDINHNRKKRLILCSNEYIDCKFGEIEIVPRYSTVRAAIRTDRRNDNNINTNDIIKTYVDNFNTTEARLMVVRLPYSNAGGRHGKPVIYEDNIVMNNPNCVYVNLESPSNFKFYIEDLKGEVTFRNQQGRPEVTGRIVRNSRILISLAPVTFEENTSPILEVDFGDRVDIYKLDKISIFYSNLMNSIEPKIFDVRFYLNSWRTIINGEATEGYKLQRIEDNTEPVFHYNPTNEFAIFVKICINKESVFVSSTNQIPHPTTRTESFRQEIETMGYISLNRDLSVEGASRLTVLESVIADLNNVYILSPFRSGKDMMDWISIPNDMFQENHCKAFLKRTSSALAYLHSLGVSHNDLSMENFISSDGSNGLNGWVENVCICDYGQSKLHAVCNNQFQPLPNVSHLGKAQYCAPEINKGPFYGFKVDVFQLAMTVLYAICPQLWQDTSRRPHVKDFHHLRNENDILIVISMKLRYRPELQVSGEFLQLLCKMLIASPDQRISMAEVRDHPVLVGY